MKLVAAWVAGRYAFLVRLGPGIVLIAAATWAGVGAIWHVLPR
jgi:hypothetical protein